MSENLPVQASDSRAFGVRDAALGGLLLFTLLLFYSPAIHGEFVFDDDRNVTPAALTSLHGLWRIWVEPGASFQYYPVLHTAFWIEHRIWGDAVFGYHLVNILLHCASAWLLVAILRKLALPGAWLAAFIFALHPVCVESVAWISEQKNTLSTVFYMASALAWLHFSGSRRWRWYLLAAAFFLMALASKTTAAILPAALLVIAWWRNGRLEWKRDVLPLLPWFAGGAAFGLFSGRIEQKGYDIQSSDFSLNLLQHFLLASRDVWFYAGKLLWPVDLSFNYPRWQVNAADWRQWLFPAGLLAVAAVFFLLARRNRTPLAAFLFFIGNLFPVMGFFYIGWFMFSFVADHFQYVASLGIIVPAAAGLALAARKTRPAAVRWATRAAIGLILFMLCSLTWGQCHIYNDMETLFHTTVDENPSSGMAHYNYGLVLLKIPDHLTEAMEQMETALRLRPEDVKLQDRIAFIFLTTPGRADEGIATLEQTLKIDPDDAYAHFLLGSTLAMMPGHIDEAITHLKASVRLNPNEPQSHLTLGDALFAMGRKQEAIAQYQEALRLDPEMEQAKARIEGVESETRLLERPRGDGGNGK